MLISSEMLFSLSRYSHICMFPYLCVTFKYFKSKRKWDDYDVIKRPALTINCNFLNSLKPFLKSIKIDTVMDHKRKKLMNKSGKLKREW